jgi:hypothetical protein
MKYISFHYVNRDTWGTYGPDGGVIDLGAEFINTIPTLRDFLTADEAMKAKVAEYLNTGFGGGGGKTSDFASMPKKPAMPFRPTPCSFRAGRKAMWATDSR